MPKLRRRSTPSFVQPKRAKLATERYSFPPSMKRSAFGPARKGDKRFDFQGESLPQEASRRPGLGVARNETRNGRPRKASHHDCVDAAIVFASWVPVRFCV